MNSLKTLIREAHEETRGKLKSIPSPASGEGWGEVNAKVRFALDLPPPSLPRQAGEEHQLVSAGEDVHAPSLPRQAGEAHQAHSFRINEK